jgi:hypothetical protein
VDEERACGDGRPPLPHDVDPGRVRAGSLDHPLRVVQRDGHSASSVRDGSIENKTVTVHLLADLVVSRPVES